MTFEEGTKLERIGWGAFGYSSLPAITIPDSVNRIDGYAFYYCSKLTGVAISENSKLESLGEYAFKADTKMTSLYIPDGVTKIGSAIFKDVTGVTLSVAENSYAQAYAEKYGIAYETRKAKLTVVASGTCGENAAWTLDSEGVLNITGDGPMADNNTNQAPWEAYKYQIKQIVIGKDITYIGKFNFFRCSRLETVTFGGRQQTGAHRLGCFRLQAACPLSPFLTLLHRSMAMLSTTALSCPMWRSVKTAS